MNGEILIEAIISFAIPVSGALSIQLYNKKISFLIYIPVLVIFLLLNFIVARQFKKLPSYVSYITSFSLFPIGFYIVISLLFVGFIPEVELSIILSLVVFLLVTNMQLLTLTSKLTED